MKFCPLAVVLAIVCATAAACGTADPVAPSEIAMPPAPSRVTLVGRLFDATSSDPLPGANFYIVEGLNKGRYAATGADGTFTFPDLEPGAFVVSYGKAGYAGVLRRELVIVADTRMDFPMSVFVPVSFALTGRVRDAAGGTALDRAEITILDGRDALRTTQTGSDGAFSLGDVSFGGFTIRIRRDGYDSVFRGVQLVADTVLDVEMRRAQQSLAGTWAGTLSGNGGREDIPELTLTQSGTTISNDAPPYRGFRFSATVRDLSTIGSTTSVSGTMTVQKNAGTPRYPVTCTGTGPLTGTVNWTDLVITAPKIVYACDGETAAFTLSLVRQR